MEILININNTKFVNNQANILISSDKNILFNKVTIDNNETFVNMINAKGNMEVSDEFVVTKNKWGQKLMVAEGQVIFNDNVVIQKINQRKKY